MVDRAGEASQPPRATAQVFQGTYGYGPYGQVQPDLTTIETPQYRILQGNTYDQGQHQLPSNAFVNPRDLDLAAPTNPIRSGSGFNFGSDANVIDYNSSQADVSPGISLCNLCDNLTLYDNGDGSQKCYMCGNIVLFTGFDDVAAPYVSQTAQTMSLESTPQHPQAALAREWSHWPEPGHVQNHMSQRSIYEYIQQYRTMAQTFSFVPDPPIPQSVINQGFPAEDFNPNKDWKPSRVTKDNYRDYPDELPEQHIFNGNPNYIAYGNLLRLSERYTINQILENSNNNRPQPVFKSVDRIYSRFKQAVKSKADKTRRSTNDVEAELKSQKIRNGVEVPKRGRPPKHKRDDQEQATGGVEGYGNEHGTTPVKRVKKDNSVSNGQMQQARLPAQLSTTPVQPPSVTMAQQPLNATTGNGTTMMSYSPMTFMGYNNVVTLNHQPTPYHRVNDSGVQPGAAGTNPPARDLWSFGASQSNPIEITGDDE